MYNSDIRKLFLFTQLLQSRHSSVLGIVVKVMASLWTSTDSFYFSHCKLGLKILTPSSIHNNSILFLIIMKNKSVKSF